MLRPVLALLALTLLAAPGAAHAQTAACEARGNDLRCAVAFPPLREGTKLRPTLRLAGLRAGAEGSVSAWVSTCGLAGRQAMPPQTLPLRESQDLPDLDPPDRSGMNACVEVFLTNCRAGGAATPCPGALNATASSLSVLLVTERWLR